MLFDLEEFGCKVWISSFAGKVDAASVMKEMQEKFPDSAVQFFDLDKIAGSRHLLLAAYNAEKSYNSKRRITRSLQMEVLLFVAGTRQISDAIQRVGINDSTTRSAVLAIARSDRALVDISESLIKKFSQRDDDELLDTWTRRRELSVTRNFGFGKKVGRAIEKLAVERSALVAIDK